MRLERLVVRGFRNLQDLDWRVPHEGAALMGRNGQGKTNLLEAVYYPVLLRSFRGAADVEVAGFGSVGFHLSASVTGQPDHEVCAEFKVTGRRKRITIDGAETPRLADAIGRWIAVVFLPSDVALAGGAAAERRHYLDRMLALAHPPYLAALSRYRAALAQRNAALRQGRGELAEAFDGPLADAGATIVRRRLEWIAAAGPAFGAELEELREAGAGTLRYRGAEVLADRDAWAPALDAARARDRARGLTTTGPHRDDIIIEAGGRELRRFGSTGQQRSAAIALKLVELETLAAARGVQPALLLDDVFAELDRGRQESLALRLIRPDIRQVFLTAPREDELPPSARLPVCSVDAGALRSAA